MACARYSDALSGVAAGGPAPAGLEAHLAECAHCRAELAVLRQILGIADHELRQLSAAEPSTNFVLRLRAAVIESGAAPAWRAVWLWPLLATAAALVMTLTLIVANRPPHEATATIGPRQPAIAQVRKPIREPAVASTAGKKGVAPPSQNRRARRRALAEPQVLVPAGESQALMEFIALVNRDRLAPDALSAAGEPSASLAALPPIEIKPIEIVPLDPAVNLGT